MTVRLDEMSWPEVKEVISRPNLIILPFGSTEQHGAHLPLNTDSAIATYLAEVRDQVDDWLSHDLLALDAAYPWTGGTRLDRAIYLVRHTHHHVGELWSEIKRRGHPLPDWW